MNLAPRERLIVALDFPSVDEALHLVERLEESVLFYKVGLELFSGGGLEVVKRLKEMGKSVFLDLKFHDIPNTVARAAATAVKSGADMFNVHALGGMEMMRSAGDAASKTAEKLGLKRPLVLAVTILTSLDRRALEEEVGLLVGDGIGTLVATKARQAKEAGLDGVVASAQEIAAIRESCGPDVHIVTPGVRPMWASADDQKRIATPREALNLGADRIVVGRPVTRANDPTDAVRKILDELT